MDCPAPIAALCAESCGAFGLLLAAPLAAALVVIVRRLYVEDVLNDQAEHSG